MPPSPLLSSPCLHDSDSAEPTYVTVRPTHAHGTPHTSPQGSPIRSSKIDLFHPSHLFISQRAHSGDGLPVRVLLFLDWRRGGDFDRCRWWCRFGGFRFSGFRAIIYQYWWWWWWWWIGHLNRRRPVIKRVCRLLVPLLQIQLQPRQLQGC
jgi:hypothetical protein